MPKEEFKIEILTQSSVFDTEDMPEYFLGDTPKEAEEIYLKYKGLMNSFAYTYSISTGIDKSALFGEAVLGLARAKRDWDESRSKSFMTYASFRIKDALNEYVRENRAIVVVPTYIKKSNDNLKKIIDICKKHGIGQEKLLDVLQSNIYKSFGAEKGICETAIKSIRNAAARAGVELSKFVERVSVVPETTNYKEQEAFEVSQRNHQMLEAATLVEQLRKFMDDEDVIICEGIMNDSTYKEIGAELGKSASWVSNKVKDLRVKIFDKTK